jgi:hypothetical protein
MAAAREHIPLLALLAGYLLARLAWTGGQWPVDGQVVALLAPAFAVLVVLVIPLLVGAHAMRATARRPGTFAAFRWETWVRFRREYFSAARLTSVLIAWAFLSVFMPLFLHWKADIGTDPAFRWDERFMAWDRALHFGRHPWEWLHPVIAHPGATRIIDTLYHLVWTIGNVPVVLVMAWSGRRALVSRFLVSYALLWIVAGTVFAYLLASAGPVYYAAVAGPAADPYAGLLSYLHGVHAEHGLASVSAASALWSDYVGQGWPRIGISAMPSMHIAIATLVVVLGFRVHRVWGVLAAVYLLTVFVGSVHLAWHYAIDGYVAALLVAPVWWLSGRLVRWWSGPGDPYGGGTSSPGDPMGFRRTIH